MNNISRKRKFDFSGSINDLKNDLEQLKNEIPSYNLDTEKANFIKHAEWLIQVNSLYSYLEQQANIPKRQVDLRNVSKQQHIVAATRVLVTTLTDPNKVQQDKLQAVEKYQYDTRGIASKTTQALIKPLIKSSIKLANYEQIQKANIVPPEKTAQGMYILTQEKLIKSDNTVVTQIVAEGFRFKPTDKSDIILQLRYDTNRGLKLNGERVCLAEVDDEQSLEAREENNQRLREYTENLFGKEQTELLLKFYSQLPSYPGKSALLINLQASNIPIACKQDINIGKDEQGKLYYEATFSKIYGIDGNGDIDKNKLIPGSIKTVTRLTEEGFILDRMEADNTLLKDLLMQEKTEVTAISKLKAQVETELASLYKSISNLPIDIQDNVKVIAAEVETLMNKLDPSQLELLAQTVKQTHKLALSSSVKPTKPEAIENYHELANKLKQSSVFSQLAAVMLNFVAKVVGLFNTQAKDSLNHKAVIHSQGKLAANMGFFASKSIVDNEVAENQENIHEIVTTSLKK